MLLAALLAVACVVLAAVAAAQSVRLRGVPSPARVDALAREVADLRARLAGAEAALAAERAAVARGERQAAEAGDRAGALVAELTEVRARLAAAEAALAAERAAAAERLDAQQTAAAALLEAERVAAAQQVRSLEKARCEADARLAERFSALSADALERSSTSFLQLAEQHLSRQRAEGAAELDARATAVAGLISPVAEVLQQVQERMQRLEVSRAEADTAVLAQVQALSMAQRELRSETANLVTALRAPAVRGRWGELQLRRVVEVAGMVRHCDFDEQVRAVGPDGA
ncbi:MAG: DNA recombination protein RmuC, partial [Acidimicrobiia bacterium]